jgi:hypothetical protein
MGLIFESQKNGNSDSLIVSVHVDYATVLDASC